MAQLESFQQREIDGIIEEGSKAYDEGNLQKAIDQLKIAWTALPEPKTIYDESYHIARFIVKLSLEQDNLQQSREWASVAQYCNPERADIGEREFLSGQVAYKAGELEEAKEFFKIANDKSEGLCFQGEDSIYEQLIK